MTMKLHKNILRRAAVAVLLAAAANRTASATVWKAWAGAQTPDLGNQILAFLPNEFWVHAGDSIQFSFLTTEPHTVSFLASGQTRPAAFSVVGVNGNIFIGCPGTTPDGSNFDNSSCVSSAPSTMGQTYTVTFPTANNYKLVCLVHSRMTGAIHVLQLAEILPHDQDFYDQQAYLQGSKLLWDANVLQGRKGNEGWQTSTNAVTAGVSTILATGGGSQTIAVMRFLGNTTVVHVGDTVEWTNLSTPVNHTITFGTEPANDMPPSQGVVADVDGVRHAVINSPSDNVNSGFLGAPNQETVGQPQAALDFTRFRVTFNAPGTFNYICAIHDAVGMKATVIVQP
jgi:plastocyanin